jgi:hypothetical protein
MRHLIFGHHLTIDRRIGRANSNPYNLEIWDGRHRGATGIRHRPSTTGGQANQFASCAALAATGRASAI